MISYRSNSATARRKVQPGAALEAAAGLRPAPLALAGGADASPGAPRPTKRAEEKRGGSSVMVCGCGCGCVCVWVSVSVGGCGWVWVVGVGVGECGWVWVVGVGVGVCGQKTGYLAWWVGVCFFRVPHVFGAPSIPRL